MSRAAEAFKLRKEVRQAQQKGQAAATGRFGRGEDGASEAHDTLQTQPQVAVKNLVPVKMDGNFNLGPMLARKVQASEYYRSLRQLTTTVPQLVDEVRHNVRSLDPWLKTSSGDAGTAFCALYRLCELRPTRKQLSGMLTQQGAPFVRALGFLFVRFVCPPDQVWDWMRPFFMDDEQFRPLMEADKPWTMGLWLESLLVEHKFAGIVLPRFPYTVDEDLRVRVGGLRAERARFARNLSERDRFVVGAKIEALYADDGKWYDAEVVGLGQTPNSFLVRYTAYGNEEEVSLGAMRQPGAAEPDLGLENVRARSRSTGRDRRSRDGRDRRDRDDGRRDRDDDRRYRDSRVDDRRERDYRDRDRDRGRDRDRERSRDRDRDRDGRDRRSNRSRSRSRSRSRDRYRRRDRERSHRRRQRGDSIDSDDEEVARRLRQRHGA